MQVADYSTTHQELGNTARQDSSTSVMVCRRSSAEDFLRDADLQLQIRPEKRIGGDLAAFEQIPQVDHSRIALDVGST
jgi:hypothetical protein